MKLNKKGRILVLFLLVLFIIHSSFIFAHDVEPPDHPVHQYITNEAQFLWKFMPSEIKEKHELVCKAG